MIDNDENPLQPVSLVEACPIGLISTEDEDGNDSKIIACPKKETGLTNFTF